MRVFSKISQVIGRIDCGVFGVFPVELSAHILSLCVPDPSIISTEKYKLLRHFGLGYKFGLLRIRDLAIIRP